MSSIAMATPTIVTTGATTAGTRRARSSIISIVAADAGLGGDTVAIRSATIAIGPALSWPFTGSQRSVRDFVAAEAASGAARVGPGPLPSSLPLFALATPVQAAALLAAAAATAFALVTRDRRHRAFAM